MVPQVVMFWLSFFLAAVSVYKVIREIVGKWVSPTPAEAAEAVLRWRRVRAARQLLARVVRSWVRALPSALPYLAILTLIFLAWRVEPSDAPGAPRGTLSPELRLVATILVYFMQFGFIAFEAGSVAKPYRLESGAKNLIVFVVSFLSYLTIGRLVHHELVPLLQGLLQSATYSVTEQPFDDVFNAGFASTVSLIVANTLTERTTLTANAWSAVVCSGFAYPLLAGLLWDGGPLAAGFGFVDTAGGCVVHVLGGSLGFFAAREVGPRFRDQAWHFLGQPPKPEERSLIPLAAVGTFFLFLGWFGFNSGTASQQDLFLRAFRNTGLAACCGTLPAVVLAAWARESIRRDGIQNLVELVKNPSPVLRHIAGWRIRELADLDRIAIGMMGGLVAVTANASLVAPYAACIEAALGGIVSVVCSGFLTRRSRRIDDPLGAIATHGGAGLVGILLTPLWLRLSPVDSTVHPNVHPAVEVQLMGCVIAIVVAWVSALVIFKPLKALEYIPRVFAGGAWEWFRRFRVRLPTQHQSTGMDGTESLVSRNEVPLASTRILRSYDLPRRRSSLAHRPRGLRWKQVPFRWSERIVSCKPIDASWIYAVRVYAIAVANCSERGPSADVVAAIASVLQHRPFGNPEQPAIEERERIALAALGAMGAFGELESCVERAKAHRANPPDPDLAVPWYELTVEYRECLVWTISVIAEGQAMTLVEHQLLPHLGMVDVLERYKSFTEALQLLREISDCENNEAPSVREFARIGYLDLRTSSLYRFIRDVQAGKHPSGAPQRQSGPHAPGRRHPVGASAAVKAQPAAAERTVENPKTKADDDG